LLNIKTKAFGHHGGLKAKPKATKFGLKAKTKYSSLEDSAGDQQMVKK